MTKSQIILYGLFFIIFGCKNPDLKSKEQVDQTNNNKFSKFDAFKINFDITDLAKYKGTSKFIGRITVTKRYNRILIIELNEFKNGITLCLKEPVGYPYDEIVDTLHSESFNQLCYTYLEPESSLFKNAFEEYNTNIVKDTTLYPGVLDPQPYQIEVFDHGKYSSIRRDIMSQKDFEFINKMLQVVKTDLKNFKLNF